MLSAPCTVDMKLRPENGVLYSNKATSVKSSVSSYELILERISQEENRIKATA